MGERTHKSILAVLVTGMLLCSFAWAQSGSEPAEQLSALTSEFNDWSSTNQPTRPFAALRMKRPAGWQPDWSRTALDARRGELLQFQTRLKSIKNGLTAIDDRIDSSLLAAAMARIHWELHVLASPGRDPGFALNQTLGSIFELLIENPQPDESQMAELIIRLRRFPAIINAAKLGLDETVSVLADAAIAKLGDVDSKIADLTTALAEYVSEDQREEFDDGVRGARQALTSYKDWLMISKERFDAPETVGEQKLRWYLGHVAMVPRSTDMILVESELALAQMGAQLALDQQRFAQAPEPTALENVQRLLVMMEISQGEIDSYLDAKGLISQPDQSFTMDYATVPPTIVPLANMGELFSLGQENEQGRRYMGEVESSRNFLEQAAWSEPRLLLTWEGTPGLNAQNLASAGNDRVIRRRASSEATGVGIALYFHEQLFKSGLYSFKPASHELALKFLAYRAALAQADIRMARGDLNFEGAVEFLGSIFSERDIEVLQSDVYQLVSNPGSAAAAFAIYGQIVRLLADASRLEGDGFSLQAFNDRLLLNAHVPIALQRWSLLDVEDELDELVEQRGRPATVPQ